MDVNICTEHALTSSLSHFTILIVLKKKLYSPSMGYYEVQGKYNFSTNREISFINKFYRIQLDVDDIGTLVYRLAPGVREDSIPDEEFVEISKVVPALPHQSELSAEESAVLKAVEAAGERYSNEKNNCMFPLIQ